MPAVGQPGEGERLAIPPAEEDRCPSLCPFGALPLEEPGGRNEDTPMSEWSAERRQARGRLGTGIDRPGRLRELFRPRRHEPPRHHDNEPSFPIDDRGSPLPRSQVVPRTVVGSVPDKPEPLAQEVQGARDYVASAHTRSSSSLRPEEPARLLRGGKAAVSGDRTDRRTNPRERNGHESDTVSPGLLGLQISGGEGVPSARAARKQTRHIHCLKLLVQRLYGALRYLGCH